MSSPGEGADLYRSRATPEWSVLVKQFEAYPGAGRTVPVRVRCEVGNHDSGNRLAVVVDGESIVLRVMGSRGYVMARESEDAWIEIEHLNHRTERTPPIVMYCHACARNGDFRKGRFLRPEMVLQLVAKALVEREKGAALGARRTRPAQFTWPIGGRFGSS